MPVAQKFLDLLVCPVCYGKLIYQKSEHTPEELWCKFDKLAYLIKDDIPIMLVEEARKLSLEEIDQCK